MLSGKPAKSPLIVKAITALNSNNIRGIL